MVLVLVLAFAVRGLLSGFTTQVFQGLGLVAGLWTAGVCSQWVGAHWQSAQPAVAFLILRWLAAAFAALAVAALFQWSGERLASAFESTPIGWVDRPGGFVLGAGMGAFVSSFVLLGLLMFPWPGGLAGQAARSRTARPIIAGATFACSLVAHYVPGGTWLKGRFQAATRRVDQHARVS
jgi:hypothetical protein